MAIKFCTCLHPGQDGMYGHQMRVMNKVESGGYRCTVCDKKSGDVAKAVAAASKDEKKKK